MPVEHNRDAFRFLQDLIADQGDVARFRNANGPVCFFNHPDHVQAVLHNSNLVRTSLLSLAIGQGLLASDGELWRVQRRLMLPQFQEPRLPSFASAVTAATGAMLDRWDGKALTGAPVDVAAEMRRLTLAVICKALFGLDLESEAEDWEEALAFVLDDLGAISMTHFNVPLQFPPSRSARLRNALNSIDIKIQRLMDDRRARGDKPDDLLSLLLAARDEQTGQALADRQVRDEIVTMLLAGHETTAIALAWAWHLLAEHPAVEERMVSEVQRTLEGRVPTVEDLSRLAYTRMVFEETMRLYPPVPFKTRRVVADDQVAGHPVAAGTVVLLSAWTTHRHKDFWEDCERFDPERFGPERSRGRHRYAFLPFAGGRHHCVGQSFAMLEGQFVLASVAARYRLRPVPTHRVEPHPAITLRQRDGFLATVEPRHDRRRPQHDA